MLEIVIAECPYCGARCYSWSEEDALERFKKHKCMATLSDKELEDILNRICEGEDGRSQE